MLSATKKNLATVSHETTCLTHTSQVRNRILLWLCILIIPGSCKACRDRKIKCDRQRPCANCIRFASDCVNPPGRGRAPRGSRQATNAQLVDRLSRLESVIQRIQHDNSGEMEQPSPMDELGHDGSTSRQETTAPDRQLGHLMINDNTSYYISNALWTSLSHEVFYLGEFCPFRITMRLTG